MKLLKSKKRYFILLSLLVITALVIPLICNALVNICPTSATGSLLMIFKIIFYTGFISSAIGTTVLVFASVKYYLKQCLPFVAVAGISTLLRYLMSLMISDVNIVKSFSLAYAIYMIVMSFVLPFVYIGIAKLFAKFMKNEIAVISAAFFALMIVSFLVQISSAIVIYYTNYKIVQIGYSAIPIGQRFTYFIFGGMPRTLLPIFYNYLYMEAAYLILFLIYHKREKLYKILLSTKTAIKRLWEATAN